MGKSQPYYMKASTFSSLICFITLFQCSLSLKGFKPINKVITLKMTPKHSNSYYDLSFLSLRAEHFLRSPNKSKALLYQQELTRTITEYSGIVHIGSPPQQFNMVFDTGSANIIVTSSYCNSTGCLKHNKYDPNRSSSSQQLCRLETYSPDIHKGTDKDKAIIHFGTGQVKCYLAKDNVCIGNGTLCSNHHLILEAYEESTIPFSHVKFDGIIGLSFTYLSISPNANFIEMLYQQRQISQRIFSFYFNINDEKKSILNIGGENSKYYTGQIHYTAVNSRNYWEIQIEGIYYGTELLVDCLEIVCSGVVDTGTSMIAAPLRAYNLIRKVSTIRLDCTGLNLLENLSFKIGGVMYALEPKFYVLTIDTPKAKNCINALMQLDALSTEYKQTFILGLPFLKKYYTVFDRENKQIGFALAKHELSQSSQQTT